MVAKEPTFTGEVKAKTTKSDRDAVFVGASVDVGAAVRVTVLEGLLVAYGIGVTEEVRVAVGGSFVGVGITGVGVVVGPGVLVDVGKLVAVRTGDSVGFGTIVSMETDISIDFGTSELQDANAIIKIERNITLPMFFKYFLA
jgi:hypothetical protein